MKTCHYCKDDFYDEDVRPYGPKGQDVCYDCAMKPENKGATKQMFQKTLDACGPNVVLELGGIRPATAADIELFGDE